VIPKRIHYCWLSGDPFPELISRCVASWKVRLPDYEFVLWDRDRFDIERFDWVREAFEAKKYAFAADYIRLHALHEQGGIYLDADVEVLGDFEPFLNHKSFMGYERSGDLEPAVIGAEQGSEWIAACLKHYEGRHFTCGDGSNDTTPLPLIVEAQLRNLGLMPPQPPGDAPIATSAITFYPADYFSPKDIHGGRVKSSRRTVAIHHFDGQWVERTSKYRLKQWLHRALKALFGASNHRRIVQAIRNRGK
jgi:hypothetical protein